MRQCIRRNNCWRGRSFIDDEQAVVLEMMEKWDSCRTFQDILRVKVGKVSVFYYHATLAPWFHGIDLVRFVNIPHSGRCLEII